MLATPWLLLSAGLTLCAAKMRTNVLSSLEAVVEIGSPKAVNTPESLVSQVFALLARPKPEVPIGMLLRTVRAATTECAKLPNVVRLDDQSAAYTVVGDIHGQLEDLLHIFELGGTPSTANVYIFNGDLVDRGQNSLGVVLLLAALKAARPGAVHIGRGNHEDRRLFMRYGLGAEIAASFRRARHRRAAVRVISAWFSALPLVHVIDPRGAVVVHGGPPRGDVSLDEIDAADRGAAFDRSSLAAALLWSDPTEAAEARVYAEVPRAAQRGSHHLPAAPGLSAEQTASHLGRRAGVSVLEDSGAVVPSTRGVGFLFGPGVTRRFLATNGMRMLVRSHQVVPAGFAVGHGGQCVTVFSAPAYPQNAQRRRRHNLGAVMRFPADPDERPYFIQYRAVWLRPGKRRDSSS